MTRSLVIAAHDLRTSEMEMSVRLRDLRKVAAQHKPSATLPRCARVMKRDVDESHYRANSKVTKSADQQ